jgi:PIN domain nuclease of toxin-antitoxin system
MILLDTHVVIWLLTDPKRISKAAADAIAEHGSKGMLPGISAASIYELIYAKRRGRIQLHTPDAALLTRMRQWFDLIPITDGIAVEAAGFTGAFHGDPMDRLIAATARTGGYTLLTVDDKIRDAGVCKVLW